MKKRILSFVLTLCMLVSMITIVPMTVNATDPEVWDGNPASGYASGSGTSGDPYIINTPAQYAYFTSRVNGGNDLTVYVKLGADLVFNTGDASTWNATTKPANTGLSGIGSNDAIFAGTFDGDGHTISGLYLDTRGDNSKETVSMFCDVKSATIKNFAMLNSCIIGEEHCGGVVGRARGTTTIQNIYCDVFVRTTKTNNGGICGFILGGSDVLIDNCVFAGSITSTTSSSYAHIGGFLGYAGGETRKITITNSLNIGAVIQTNNKEAVSGFIGQSDSSVVMSNCINAVAPTSTGNSVTDLCRFTSAGNTRTLTDCYYVTSNPHDGTVGTETGLEQKTVADFLGDTAITWTGWTERKTTGQKDIIIPSGVAAFAPESQFFALANPQSDLWPEWLRTYETASEFTITTAQQLNELSVFTNSVSTVPHDFAGKTIKLGANITLNTGDASTWATTPPANVFKPIGVNTSGLGGVRDNAFSGTFDGQGYTISGLYVNVTDAAYDTQGAGLFGIIGPTAVVKDFAVVNSYVKSNRAVGVIGLALADGFLVDSIYSEIIVEGTANVGGIVGQLTGTSGESATISNCLFTGSVNATKEASSSNSASGGILGNGNSRFIQVVNCLNVGSVTATGNFIAGIVGRNDTTTTITNCINIGNIIQAGTSEYTAGIWSGALKANNTVTMTECYSTGNTLFINSTNYGTITPTNVGYFNERFLGTNAQVFEGWTARAADIMVPTAVVGYLSTDVLNSNILTLSGAAVRLIEPTGLRFSGVISKAYIDNLNSQYGNDNVSFGMIITPTVYLTAAGNFTIEALEAAGKTYKEIEAKSVENIATASEDGYYKFNAVLSNVKAENESAVFSAITYVRYNDGSNTVYKYANTIESRSINIVVERALSDVSSIYNSEYKYLITGGSHNGKYSPYTDEERNILKGIIETAKTTYEYTPVELQRITPESAGISSAYVSELVDGLAQNNLAMHSIMILKDGKVFAEGYADNYDEDSLNRMYSISKSFVSMAIGLLIEEGKISLDDTVAEHFPEYVKSSTDTRILNTTIENMLEMSTPFSHGNYTGTDSTWIENFFTDKVDKTPGSSFYYDTLGTYLLGAIVERQTGMDFLEYLKVRALNKIGFSPNSWCVEAPEGYAWGGSGVMCTTSDLAKFALLVMNGGVYNGEQLLPADYVHAATSYQIDNYEGSTTSYYGQGYGYQIWLTPYGFTFLGMGNQLAICVPDKNLIFVCTADTQGNTPAREIIFNLFEEKIMNNIQESPLAENQAAYNTMQTKLENMLLPIVQGQTTVAMASTVNNRTYTNSNTSALFSKVTFEFFGDYGVLSYTTPRGDKELTFGLGRNVVCMLDEPQYSGTRIGVPNGVGYRSACSGAWTDEDTFVLSVQVIDDYLGNMKLTFDFTANSVTVKGAKTAEFFLDEYKTSGITLN